MEQFKSITVTTSMYQSEGTWHQNLVDQMNEAAKEGWEALGSPTLLGDRTLSVVMRREDPVNLEKFGIFMGYETAEPVVEDVIPENPMVVTESTLLDTIKAVIAEHVDIKVEDITLFHTFEGDFNMDHGERESFEYELDWAFPSGVEFSSAFGRSGFAQWHPMGDDVADLLYWVIRAFEEAGWEVKRGE